jgi:proteasome accessory factor B
VDRIIGSPVTGTAMVWVADGHAHDVRRLGTRTGRRRIGDRDGDVLELTVRSRDWTARLIAGHGPDALVLAPEDLRADVIARLTAAR